MPLPIYCLMLLDHLENTVHSGLLGTEGQTGNSVHAGNYVF